MFEVGSKYKVFTLQSGVNADGKQAYYESSIVYEVGEVSGNMVKFLEPNYSTFDKDLLPPGFDYSQPRTETIINTTNLFFVRADKV